MERMIVKVPASIVILNENKKSDFIKNTKNYMTEEFLEKYGSLENYDIIFKKVPWSTLRWSEEIDNCRCSWKETHWGRYVGSFETQHINYRLDGKEFGSQTDLVEYIKKYKPFDLAMEASLRINF